MAALAGLGIELSRDMLDPAKALGWAGDTLLGLGSVLSNGFLILLTVIFILAEASTFPRKLRTVLDDPERDLPYFERFAEKVNRYIAIKTTVSLATGAFVSLALAVIGVEHAILWGLLAFLLNYVPTIGSAIAAVPPVALGADSAGRRPCRCGGGRIRGGQHRHGQCG